MTYEVVVPKKVAKQIEDLPVDVQQQVLQVLRGLKSLPRPVNSKKMASKEPLYRVRIGAYRIIYAIDDGTHQVVIERVAHRKEVYR